MRCTGVRLLLLGSKTLDTQLNFRTLFETMVDATIIMDRRSVILDVNSATTHIFGFERDELIGQDVSILMPTSQAMRHGGYVDSYMDTGKAKIIGIGRQVMGRRKDGSHFPARLSVGHAVVDGNHQFIGILSDISREKEAEARSRDLQAQLHHVARVGAVTEMGSALAHELNQPLTALMLYLSAASKTVEESQSSSLKTLFDKASEEAMRASAIIKRIRQMVENRPVENCSFDLIAVIDEALDMVSFVGKRHNVAVSFEHPMDHMNLFGDRVGLGQVFTNIFKNAIDAMIEAQSVGPQIQVTVTERRGTLPSLSGSDDMDDGHGFGASTDTGREIDTGAELRYVEILVEDSGPGIDDTIQERMFDAFQTTKADGLGIGLSVSKGIIQAFNGHVTAERSATLGGAMFRVRLPIDEGSVRDGE